MMPIFTDSYDIFPYLKGPNPLLDCIKNLKPFDLVLCNE